MEGDVLREVLSPPSSPSTSFSQAWLGEGLGVGFSRGDRGGAGWLKDGSGGGIWPLTLRELGGVVVDIAEGDRHRGAARQPPHVATHVLGLNHH